MNQRHQYERDYVTRTLAPVLSRLRADPLLESKFLSWIVATGASNDCKERPNVAAIAQRLGEAYGKRKSKIPGTYIAVALMEFAMKEGLLAAAPRRH